jgi:NAD(P)-dependent dehydrogenase (short-subunit alcohol dehydrogenase family)
VLLKGRVAVLAGVGPGMGRDVALALAREGADLVLGARRQRTLDAVANEVSALGGRVRTVPTDITDPAQCEALATTAAQAFSGIDILVNNAAHGGEPVLLADSDPGSLRTAVEVNLFGTLNMTRAAVPHLRARGEGRIIMINTNVSQVVVERFGGYGLSKSALLHATRHLAHELGRDGIRVNSVLPGPIWGRALRRYFEGLAEHSGVSFEEVVRRQRSTTALGYLPPSSEIAGTVVYLASDLSRPVTGQAIRVDCGQWLAAGSPEDDT